MTQQYTPVEWTDETPTQPGTLINKERLDQMQTAHHYADGFEEVDTAPSADPGVAYHKVVYCTADSTFYRWTGTEWQKDIDDDTKALLLAHEADHSNPHVVTKAQVGLGNADNTADLDKPISTATQTALDGKVDDSQIITAWGTPTDAQIASAKLAKDTLDTKAPTTALTDGSVTKVGTGNVGSDTKPIKLVAGVPTAVTNTLLDNTTVQVINNSKIFSHSAATSAATNVPTGSIEKLGNITVNSTTANRYFFLGGATRDSADRLLAGISMRYNANGNVHFALGTTDSAGEMTATEIALFNRSTDTWSPTMTNAALDSYAPMVRTANAQTIAGVKTFTDSPEVKKTLPLLNLVDPGDVGTTTPAANRYSGVVFRDQNNNEQASVDFAHYTNGNKKVYMYVKGQGGTASQFDMYSYPDGTGYMTGPNRAYNTSNTSDVVTIALLKASTDVVHTSGAETAAGYKTWTGEAKFMARFELNQNNPFFHFTNNGYIKGTAPASNKVSDLRFEDSNNDVMGRVVHTIFSDGDGTLRLATANAADNAASELVVACTNAGDKFVRASYRAYNANNTGDVVTIGLLDGYTPMVRTSGNQSIAGQKTFTDRMFIINNNPHLNLNSGNNMGFVINMNTDNSTQAPTVDKTAGIYIRDANNVEMGKFELLHGTSGRKVFRMSIRATDGTYTTVDLFQVAADGTVTYAWS